jgi:hypothetical protein
LTYRWTDEVALKTLREQTPSQQVIDKLTRFLELRLEGLTPSEANNRLAKNTYGIKYTAHGIQKPFNTLIDADSFDEAIALFKESRVGEYEIILAKKGRD